ncbi:histidine phosphatase family protein [Paenibacillus nasutitermitis]|uniref:Alpha-ribazole phosphatase n=1 Tax=Paenibacillus nasutitermitis TaxID=1652958 RepID=A0A916YWK1_9BACL|nr:histidine phosphatase family protein [Paenibacillus nasutitermitis]GGD64477.1 alpha-ribazole phosphatase [Paenibacillus nasutitermitis]
MTRFYLMRHGETEWNRDRNRYCGRSDIPLSDVGREQAAAASLQLVGIDLVYASDLRRAIDTATFIAQHRQLPILMDERLTEADFGSWDGLWGNDIEERYPDCWNSWKADPTSVKAGETGESGLEIYRRMDGFFKEKAMEHPGKRILVVSHSTAIRIYLAGMLSMPLRAYRQLTVSNATISVLETSEEEGMRLLLLNGTY